MPTNGAVIGTYQWDATYGGNANNNTVNDINRSNEQVTVNQAAPVLGGSTADTVTEGSTVTLGATDTAAFSDDTLGNVTITGLPANLYRLQRRHLHRIERPWIGTAAQFDALNSRPPHAGTSTLSISATTTGTDAGAPATETYTLDCRSGGAKSGRRDLGYGDRRFTVRSAPTDTAAFSDDTLGNVTITGMPANLTGFNGGTYTASTGTWTGTAAQFDALQFTTATAGTPTLSISATTTGTDLGAPATETYTLTVEQAPWLYSGSTDGGTGGAGDYGYAGGAGGTYSNPEAPARARKPTS